MDFGFTKEQEQLRKEIYEFYLNILPEDFEPEFPAFNKELQDFWKDLALKVVERGYYVPGWSKESGGQGLTHIEQGIVNEQEGHFGIRWPNSIGLHVLGPALHIFGTEEQRKKYLPLLASGKTIAFQAFTEPDAGSDESNIRTRAILDGNDYVLNGQKIYIGMVYKPDLLYVLTRTQDSIPKHRGCTLFMVDADTPGITFRPLHDMSDGGGYEIFFDNVRVPKENMLGQLIRGFYHVMEAYEFERTSTFRAPMEKRNLSELIQFCKETRQNGRPLWDDTDIKDKLAEMAIEIEVAVLAGWETTWHFAERKRLGPFPLNMTSYFQKVIRGSHSKKMLDIMGLYGQLKNGSKWAALAGRLETLWRETRSLHPGGTFEVQKMTLAERGLGLPRIPSKLRPVIGQAVKEEAKKG